MSCCFYPDKIKDFLGDGRKFGVRIRYVVPTEDYGTEGAVKLSEKFIDDNFIVISGDVLTDFNLSAIASFHKSRDTTATISLYSSKNPLQFGIVLTDDKQRVVRFLEKPSSSEVFSDTINTGIYLFKKSIFNYIPAGENFDFSRTCTATAQGKIPIYGYKTPGYWRGCGNLEEVYRCKHGCS
ncbi:MAG: nucleotidyltransferase family protein [Ignavibacteria bacterium]|nr:nucleotidyltransferase family protein [Ignavibacteria bacterium]